MAEPATVPTVESEAPAGAELQDVDEHVPYRDAAADWVIPDATRLNEEVFDNFDLQTVSHVVLIISRGREEEIMSQAGIRYDAGSPAPCWHHIGKIVSRALLGRDDGLEILNYVSVRRTDYVAFSTRRALDGQVTGVNAIEAMFKKPQRGTPMKCFWKPARQLAVTKIQGWLANPRPFLG